VGASKKSCILEEVIPGWIDLVIWGHEHESIPEIKACEATQVYFLQPGSTTYTSLIEAESKQKHCFLFEITEKSFSFEAIPLRTMRPLIYKHIELSKAGEKFMNDRHI